MHIVDITYSYIQALNYARRVVIKYDILNITVKNTQNLRSIAIQYQKYEVLMM